MENIDWNDPASICDAVLNFESDDPNVNEAVDNIDHSDPTSFFRTMGAGQPGRMLMPEFADAKTTGRLCDKSRIATKRLSRSDGLRRQRINVRKFCYPRGPTWHQHRPDFDAFKRETNRQRETGTKFKDAYMWPYINLEDSTKPKTMPLFLDARAKNSPDAFTNADENATYLGRVSKGINTVFLNEHTMMFINRKSPETYGELIPWSENDKAFEWMMSKKGMNPGQGLLTMEVQERVFKFLVAYCRLVLHDIPAEKLTSDDYPVLLRPNVPTETGDGFASLGVMAAEAPYRAPDRMDLAKMESLLDAKASAAEDHIWALREDPSYFADVLLEYKEHRQEILKDTKGRAHPVFTIPQHDVFWQRAVGTTISAAHRDVEVWNELLSQVKHLRRLESKYAAAISIEKDLPEKFVNALLRFRWYLEQCSLGPKNEIKLIAAPSPPLRQYFVRKPPQDPMSSIIEMEAKLNRNLNKIQAEFWWLLQTLLEDGQQLFFLRLTNLVDELDRLIQSEPDAKEMVSGYLARILEDLAVFSEGLKQNQLFQPWAQSLDYIMADRIGDMKREFNEHIQRCGDHLAALRGSDTMRALALGAPTDGKFYYPVDKRRTKENVDFMRKAESDLDQFWTGVDDILRRNAGDKLDGTALGRLLSQSRSLQRTAPWIEKMQALTSKTSEPDVELPMKPLSELYLNLQQKEGTTGREVLKENVPTSTKAKTRGAATSAVAAEDHQHLPPSELPDEQPLFPVDARSLKVFRTLFYTPSVNANPGEVPWTDFLHAMQSTGFVPQKLYGSVWQFSPTKLDVERSIQFHEPHPSGKLPYKTAHRFGRRLERAYGWFSSMFVLKEKSVESKT